MLASRSAQTESVNRTTLLEKKLTDLQQAYEEAELYRQWADRIIYRRFNYEETAGKGAPKMPPSSLDGKVISETQQPGLLDIDELEVRRFNLELDFDVSFKLINATGDSRKLSGFVFIVASNTEVVPSIYAAWPQVDIVSGMPGDFRKGLEFSIRSLKKVNGRITQPSIGPKFNRVDLIAYSDDGNIVMKKGYYIERMLQQNPYESGQ
jgi:hypothetical protein